MMLKVVLVGGKTIVGRLIWDADDHLVLSVDGMETVILKESIKKVEIVLLC
jgi:hypothetical protein